MPTLGNIYDYVARELAKGKSVEATIDRAITRYGEPWAETVRELTKRAVAAFAAGSRITAGDPSQAVPAEELPYTLGVDRRIRYLIQYWHNPGELQWVELLRSEPISAQQAAESTRQLATTTRPDQPTAPAGAGGDVIYPPQPAELEPGVIVIVITRAERLYPIGEYPLERGQEVPLPGREIES